MASEFIGKAHKTTPSMGDIYTCMYSSTNNETVSETWEVVAVKKCGWVSIVPIGRKVTTKSGEIRNEIHSTAEAMSSFQTSARIHSCVISIGGDLYLSLHVRNKGAVKIVGRHIPYA
jgi:mevalonate kinase